MTDIPKLFVKFHPIVYFYRKEPYMPADMDEILKISNVDKNNIPELVPIPKDKRQDVPVGKQILCKTDGEYKIGKYIYIDLVYIVTFTWNGTLEEHAFDKEEIVIRLRKEENTEYKITRIFGSAHGNGFWFLVDKNEIEFENDQPIMYSANESHAMYNKARLHKRIFGFGNDITGKDKKWEPTQFVIFNNDNVLIYDNTGTNIQGDYAYFKTPAKFGDSKNSQPWPGSLHYDVTNLDAYYKFQGGIDNLFTGRYRQVKPGLRIAFRVFTILAWLGFIGYLVFRDVLSYKAGEYTNKEFILYILLHIFIVFVLFMTGTVLGLDVFVLNPINTPY